MKTNLPDSFTKVDLANVATALGLKTQTGVEFLRLALEQTVLFDGKQHDYGPKNISDFGTFGVVVRMNDKFQRIKNLYNKGRRRRAVNESIRDSFRDIANYAIIAYMLETNQWPESDKPRPENPF